MSFTKPVPKRMVRVYCSKCNDILHVEQDRRFYYWRKGGPVPVLAYDIMYCSDCDEYVFAEAFKKISAMKSSIANKKLLCETGKYFSMLTLNGYAAVQKQSAIKRYEQIINLINIYQYYIDQDREETCLECGATRIRKKTHHSCGGWIVYGYDENHSVDPKEFYSFDGDFLPEGSYMNNDFLEYFRVERTKFPPYGAIDLHGSIFMELNKR